MANNASNSQRKSVIVLSIINFIYLMLSVILLAPKTYWDSQEAMFSKAYGAASTIYSVGILFAFFEKMLSSENAFMYKYQRATNLINVGLASLNILAIALYYLVFSSCSYIINISYFLCVMVTAGVALFQAVLPAVEYINQV